MRTPPHNLFLPRLDPGIPEAIADAVADAGQPLPGVTGEIDTVGTLHVGGDHVTVELTRRTWTPVLLQVGFAEMDLPIPWWGGQLGRCF